MEYQFYIQLMDNAKIEGLGTELLRILLKRLFRRLELNIWNSNYGMLQIGVRWYLMNWELIWRMVNGSMTADGSWSMKDKIKKSTPGAKDSKRKLTYSHSGTQLLSVTNWPQLVYAICFDLSNGNKIHIRIYFYKIIKLLLMP